MSAEKHKQLIRNMVEEIWNQANFDNINEYFAEDSVEHNPYGDVVGPDGIRQFLTAIHNTYDDYRLITDNIVADGNFVAHNFTVQGEQSGSVGEMEPTHNFVEFDGVYLARIEDGKIVEAWNHFDALNLLRQLGQVPESTFLNTRVKQISPRETEPREDRPEHRPRA